MSKDVNIMDIEDIFTNEIEPKKEESFIPPNGMKIYYSNFFPYEIYFYWLGQGNIDQFQRREFSFTLENDVYFRFQSFSSSEELRKKLISYCPKKIDIGAIYNVLPTQHKEAETFFPQEKEIVFDIDMTDYDDIRTCCQEAKLCDKCWKYMIVAYEILDQILKEDFGFHNILYAFSGRRGIHAWICDERARRLQDNGRAAIANYIKYKISNIKLEVSQGLKEPIHPLYERAIIIIDKYFKDVLEEQNLLNDEKGKNLIKGLIKAYFGNEIQMEKIDNILNSKDNKVSRIKLELIEDYMKKIQNQKKNNKSDLTRLCISDFKLNILYPRLDINVSTHINHLLKSPFCIHPKTGLVAVPLSKEEIMNFKIEDIPRLDRLVEDFKNNRKNGRFEKHIQFFQNFVNHLNKKDNLKN